MFNCDAGGTNKTYFLLGGGCQTFGRRAIGHEVSLIPEKSVRAVNSFPTTRSFLRRQNLLLCMEGG